MLGLQYKHVIANNIVTYEEIKKKKENKSNLRFDCSLQGQSMAKHRTVGSKDAEASSWTITISATICSDNGNISFAVWHMCAVCKFIMNVSLVFTFTQ